MMIAVIAVFFSSFQPVQTHASATVLPKAAEGLNLLLDVIGIASGIRIPQNNSTCICEPAWWEVMACLPNFCISRTWNDSPIEDWSHRHANPINVMNHANPAGDDVICPEVKEKIRNASIEMQHHIENARRRANRPDYEPPQKPPHWGYRLIAGTMVPVLLYNVNAPWIETLIHSWRNIAEETMYSQGYYFCPRYFDFFHRDYWDMRPHRPGQRPPHQLFIGYHISGLPVLQIASSNWNVLDNSYFRAAITQHGLRRSFTLDGDYFSIYMASNTSLRVLRNGEQIHSRHISNNGFGAVLGFYIRYSDGRLMLAHCDVTASSSPYRTRHGNVSFIYVDLYPLVQPDQSAPGITLDPVNALNNVTEVLERIRERANNPDADADAEPAPMAAFPLLVPEFFPDIPADHFPEFARRVLEEMTWEDVIVPGREADEIRRRNPNIPWFFPQEAPAPQPQPGLTPRDLREIERQLQQQTRILEDFDLGRLTRPLEDILREIEKINQPPPDYWDEIYISPFEFDLRIDLMDYFPFSLPRDFVDIISILLGQMPAEMAGATTQERAVFFHYIETGYVAEEYYFLIEPMFFSSVAPRFELYIPMPDFSQGLGWQAPSGDLYICIPECWVIGSCPACRASGSGRLVHVFTLDFADPQWATMVQIIRLSNFVMFMFTMMTLTRKFLVW